MDCKKVQEFILTDYIDGRMADKQMSLVEGHLAYCRVCKDLLINLKKELVEPLTNAPSAAPDASLWLQIKQTIEEEQLQQVEKSLVPDFWERVRSAVHIPRPAMALASIVTMIFMIGSTGQLFINSQFVKINGPDQVAYLSSLINEPLAVDTNNGNDPQTPIEQYFL